MMKGKIYVDILGGPEAWFGMFYGSQKGIYIQDNLWSWYVVSSRIVRKGVRVDNYYGRREAKPEEIKEIGKILGNLNLRIDKDTGDLEKILEDDKQVILNKLKNRETLTESDIEYLIKYLKSC